MLSEDCERYVAIHHTLGFKFRIQAGLLRSFVIFAEAWGDDVVHAAQVVVWAREALSPAQRRNRLLTVRRFALAMRAEDPRHEMPSAGAFGRAARADPALYLDGRRDRPVAACSLMYRMLFGLLAATGLRSSEALALRVRDLGEDGLLVLETKFRKSRLVPVRHITRDALNVWLDAHPACADAPLLRSTAGTSPSYNTVGAVFRELIRSVGIRPPAGKPGARLHDLRHTFAVWSLERCGSDRAAIDRHMVALSTYLGHADVTDTYWYLQATPTLMTAIAQAGEALYRRDAT